MLMDFALHKHVLVHLSTLGIKRKVMPACRLHIDGKRSYTYPMKLPNIHLTHKASRSRFSAPLVLDV